ncbi:methylmalonyl-CoA mutase [Nonlabens spongiae]|uniref:Methylmalonyl-CoA mutase n=1 Tax=Nonlabens spongiae TaxID=331648 RepID=A0A1W6MIU5_9FLAO|nr:methylmalonyl-CoA mutase subunit beta [Nonlabens spongiae]ARN77512.1 methylmalonyl-CoA mutase [Nonlabens spongiae]
MSKRLFEDFEGVSEAQWKQKIQYDLKGADYNDTLISTTPDGIHIKPFYHSESSEAHEIPFTATQTGDWYVSQKIYAYSAETANLKAKNALKRGAEGVVLVIPNPEIDAEVLLKSLPEVGIQIHLEFFDLEYIENLNKLALKAYIHIDPIHRLASTGNWFASREKDLKSLIDYLKISDGYFSNITVNTNVYQQAGATTVQELGYFLAHLNEYLNVLEQAEEITDFTTTRFDFAQRPNHSDHGKAKRINLDTTTGSDYFMEIAKYRAYRVLTKSLGNEYGIENLECYISASPSMRNKTLLDYNVNMLRTTTECMSAVLGGADTVYNLPYDAFFNKPNEFGERISRNQLLVLKEEAYFNNVGNAAEGSYYIETLTQQLVEKALELFKQLESAGGLISSLHEGSIQRKIKESADREQQALKHGDKVLVGATKYPNADQPLLKEYEILPFVKIEPRKTLIEPIVQKRLMEEKEKEEMRKL